MQITAPRKINLNLLACWTSTPQALISRHDISAHQNRYCNLGRPHHCLGPLRTFRYLRDPLFLSSCLLYAINRWALKPHVPHGFLAWWFNDLFLIPCAVPICLWIEKKLGARKHDNPPTLGEVTFYLIFWSVFFEVLTPHFIARDTGDWRDAVAYTLGALVAWFWWNRPQKKRA